MDISNADVFEDDFRPVDLDAPLDLEDLPDYIREGILARRAELEKAPKPPAQDD